MKHLPVILLAALLLVPLVVLHAADVPKQSDTIRIHVAAENPQWQISKYLTGMHFVYGFERDSLYKDERIADWMRLAKVGIIRWPGGTAVQTYHWDQLNGVSFDADTWDSACKAKPAPPAEYMDLDEYIAFCRRVGAEPLVGVNLRSGRKYNRLEDSLDEARRLIQYCKDKNYKVRHWYIGNECFIGWSPQKYAEDIDRYAEVLKSVDPDIVIIGDWKLGPESKHRFEQTLLIAKTSKQINVIEVHEKWGTEWGLSENDGVATLANWQKQAGLYGGRLDAFIERFLAEMKAAGKNVQLGFNEWGAVMTGKTGPFPVALVKADYLITLFRHSVYSACDWNLNMGPAKSKILITTNDGHVLAGFNPAAKVFELCSAALEKQSVPMTSSDRFVYGFAVKDSVKGSVQVYLLNKYSNSINVELTVDGMALRDARYNIASFTEPGVIQETKTRLTGSHQPPIICLAPLSFSRITLDIPVKK